MKFTIIVPAYNSSLYIDRCINSIINQTYKNIEVIVINDGSIDDTLEKIKKYNVKIINLKNSGVSVARNKGLDIATGDYITFIDSDDYIDSDYISSVYDIIKKKDYDIIETSLKFEIKIKNKMYLYKEYNSKETISNNFNKEFFENELRYVIGVFYKKSIINSLRFNNNIRCYEDGLFNLEVKLNSKSYYLYPLYKYHYVQYFNSLSKTISDKHLDYNKVMKMLYDKYNSNIDLFEFVNNIIGNNVLAIVLFKLPYFKNKNIYRKEMIKNLKLYAPLYYKKHKFVIFILNGNILIRCYNFIISNININKLIIRFQSKKKIQ